MTHGYPIFEWLHIIPIDDNDNNRGTENYAQIDNYNEGVYDETSVDESVENVRDNDDYNIN